MIASAAAPPVLGCFICYVADNTAREGESQNDSRLNRRPKRSIQQYQGV
jgi:hypothetical protein